VQIVRLVDEQGDRLATAADELLQFALPLFPCVGIFGSLSGERLWNSAVISVGMVVRLGATHETGWRDLTD
jgi:hypothetical protein